MTEAKRKKLMYGILVAAVIWGAWNFAQPRRTTLPAETPAPTEVTGELQAAALPTAAAEAKRRESWGRDPFSGASAQTNSKAERSTTASPAQEQRAEQKHGWSLTGIIDNGTTPYAFINGKMVKAGDLVDQAQVIKIDKQTVILSVNGSRITLKVNKG